MSLRKYWSRRSLGRVVLAASVLALLASGAAFFGHHRGAQSADTPASYEFALWGDEPYGAVDIAKMPALIKDMNDANVAFSIFDGDTKDGSSVCSNAVIVDQALKNFNSLIAPAVYAPGDNEWTDCHRTNNGAYNSLERLDTIRKAFFNTNLSLGQNKMTLDQQGAPGAAYSENARWVWGNVVYVTLNIPGSNNNKIDTGTCFASNTNRTQADCDADNVEYAQRDAANIGWLRRSFDTAKTLNAPAIMIVIQADMGFDLPETSLNEATDPSYRAGNYNGYDAFIQVLTDETKAFKGQVVLVHGDTHYFKVDKPLTDSAHPLYNFTRVETFGSGKPHWVKVTVNPKDRNVFTFEPMVVPGN